MKKISPIWFLESPIDAEHKHYVLLDFLQSVKEDIKAKEINPPTKKIFSMVKEMEYFKQNQTLAGYPDLVLSDEEEIILGSVVESKISTEEEREIRRIVDSSLNILYRYAHLGISLRKTMESRIKMYSLTHTEDLEDNGITIFRNMSTDEIFCYWWKRTEIIIQGQTKRGIMLKKVPILNNKYSLSYEFILHESMSTMGISTVESFHCTIIEISENFNQDSEIFRMAKEKFIQEIDQE